MNLFVTGGAGYIGSVYLQTALDAGHRVTVWDNLSEGHRTAVDARADFVQGDLEEKARLLQALQRSQAEAVVHFAANALVGESMADPGKYFANNVANGINLLNAAVAAKVRRFVFSSSCATYGPPDQPIITEETPQRPINPYGESKLILEKILGWHQRIHGLEVVILRYFNAAGASSALGEHHRRETHLIPNALKVALGQAPHCEIFGTDYPTPDGTCIRDYIHVIDLARAHLLALPPGGRQGAYNLGSGAGCSVRQVIQACERASGRKIPVLERPRRPGDPPQLVASAEKAKQDLGWTPQCSSLQEIVRSAWEWQRTHPAGYAD